MELRYKDMIKALNAIEDERRIPESVIIDALKEAMAKAYKKDAELSDINVEAEINEKKQTIDIYQIYNITENVEDDELEMELEDARQYDPEAVLGGTVRRKVEITEMSRAAATLARNVMRQKIREAEKVAVYNEYIDQKDDMVLGIIESVKDKFTLVNLGKTVAMMPRSAEIPGERLSEGQKIRVVITEVNKDTKGSQVLVSRADPMLVRRLFEKEVPEIFQGIVEIKAIAREAGERTKMAVMSHNAEIDPIGACIGQRGSRVQEIIDELHGEKIDIFQWNEDITQLVKNALAPAEIKAVLPGEDERSLLVIVDADQLSLAIGKRGKNARLAVKLTNHKIDIKTREELEEMGKDYDTLVAEAEVRLEAMRRERERREIERLEAEARAAEEKRMAALAALAEQRAAEGVSEEPEELIPEEMQEAVAEKIHTEFAMKQDEEEHEEEAPAAEPVQEAAEAAEPAAEEEPVQEAEAAEEPAVSEPEAEEEEEETAEPAKQPGRTRANLEEMASKNDYVSVFEKFANTSKPKTAEKPKRRKRKSDEDEFKTRNKDLEAMLKKDINPDFKPVYTQEELDEIEYQQELEEESQYDIDYDEYEDYYRDDEENM
ncbi:MAG: transcription termination/antitermination protein NusA [Solobacterium sp.]|nr:transcription termination/antitermination protein NusA [Solobacterium sp.]